MFEKQKQWAAQHLYINNANHVAAGFGLAVVLQHYIAGGAFLPVGVGWVLIAFSLAVHAYEFTR